MSNAQKENEAGLFRFAREHREESKLIFLKKTRRAPKIEGW